MESFWCLMFQVLSPLQKWHYWEMQYRREMLQCHWQSWQTVIDDWECGFVECSARENVNISEAFKELLSKVKTERGDGLLQVGTVSRHCFVRTQSIPAMFGFRRQDTRESVHKLRKRQTCSISWFIRGSIKLFFCNTCLNYLIFQYVTVVTGDRCASQPLVRKRPVMGQF